MTEEPQLNPYAAGASVAAVVEPTDAETFRRKYLSHEASVKSIGSLFLIGGVIGFLASIAYLVIGVTAFVGPNVRPAAATLFVVGVVLLAFSVGQLVVAVGVRKLEPWSRRPAIVLAMFGLLAFPVGTLISGYILYLLVSLKGKMVFTAAYREAMRLTPRIQYKTSMVTWIAVALLVLLIGSGVVFGLVVG